MVCIQLGALTIESLAALAPMAGVADRAFREMCAEFGSVYQVGEMASAKGMCYGSAKTAELFSAGDKERPMAVQLFGDDPQIMACAARMALEYHPDVIDINMGCPAPKIVGNGGGAALHKSPDLAQRIVCAVVKAVDLPVTVKIRKGWDDLNVNAVDMAKRAEDAGAAAVTVHGRTRAQMYTPPVDLDIIAAVKQAVAIPVIGNGDIVSAEMAHRMYEHTGCDLVMVGRGALGRPWIFQQINALLRGGITLPDPGMEERMGILLRQIATACEYKGEYKAMREARTHAAWYLKGMHGAAALRAKAGQLVTYKDLCGLARFATEAAAQTQEH